MKNKISEFAEDSRFHQAQKWDYQQRVDLDVESLVTEEILGLVTLNRFKNVISKVGRFPNDNNQLNQQVSLLTELLIWDVLDSFNDTEYEADFNNLSNESQQIIMDKLGEAARKLVARWAVSSKVDS